MKILVTGASGQLGYDVVNELNKRGHNTIGTDVALSEKLPIVTLDITDEDAVSKTVAEINPDAVIHCAARTAVDIIHDKVAKPY